VWNAEDEEEDEEEEEEEGKCNQLLARLAMVVFLLLCVPRKKGAPSTRLAWEALVSRMAEHTITVVPSSANRSSRYCLQH
jgi:hypothetical protein